MIGRISKIEYAMRIAEVAALRSEDPHRQVGAVAMTVDGQIVATGYNGLPPGVNAPDPEFWADKERRKPYVVHAEQNLCSRITRGMAQVACVTLQPCPDCFRALVTHGIRLVVYRTKKQTCAFSEELSSLYKIPLILWPEDSAHYSELFLRRLEK